MINVTLVVVALLFGYLAVWLVAADDPPIRIALLVDLAGWLALLAVVLMLGFGKRRR